MGSAFSSTAKVGSSSLLMIGRAAKVVGIVLLFVAGGVSTLHRADSSPPWIPPRKILRAEAGATAGWTRRNRCANQSRRPESSYEPLPRGLTHKKTNLEMEPLIGDPEWRMKEAAAAPAAALKPKSLLAVPVGINNKEIVDKLVSKFAAADFAIMLFHYDGAVEQWADMEWSKHVVHVAAMGQTKWWFAKRFLLPEVVAEYEYVFLWDEDIEVDAFDPARL
ncbi:unnamed protein product [Urochloa humidicola]